MRRRLIPSIAMLVAVGIAGSLGFWQLDRAAQKEALQARLDRAVGEPPTQVAASRLDAASLDGAPVAASGRWISGKTIFLDNRTHNGVAGFHVFTPLRPDAGADSLSVLVLRGFVPRDLRDRQALPSLPDPAEPVRVSGRAVLELPQAMVLGEDLMPGPDQQLWQRFTIERYRQWSGLAVQDFVIRQEDGATSDGLIRDWPVPGQKIDMHYGYALQWFGIALSAVAFWAWAMFLRPEPPVVNPSPSDAS